MVSVMHTHINRSINWNSLLTVIHIEQYEQAHCCLLSLLMYLHCVQQSYKSIIAGNSCGAGKWAHSQQCWITSSRLVRARVLTPWAYVHHQKMCRYQAGLKCKSTSQGSKGLLSMVRLLLKKVIWSDVQCSIDEIPIPCGQGDSLTLVR